VLGKSSESVQWMCWGPVTHALTCAQLIQYSAVYQFGSLSKCKAVCVFMYKACKKILVCEVFQVCLCDVFKNINISGLEFGVGDLIVGWDEERALTKAVETCFPLATTLLCCRHLQENVRRRLQDKVAVPVQLRYLSGVYLGLKDLQAGAFGF